MAFGNDEDEKGDRVGQEEKTQHRAKARDAARARVAGRVGHGGIAVLGDGVVSCGSRGIGKLRAKIDIGRAPCCSEEIEGRAGGGASCRITRETVMS